VRQLVRLLAATYQWTGHDVNTNEGAGAPLHFMSCQKRRGLSLYKPYIIPYESR